jgi:hypothetical protein
LNVKLRFVLAHWRRRIGEVVFRNKREARLAANVHRP